GGCAHRPQGRQRHAHDRRAARVPRARRRVADGADAGISPAARRPRRLGARAALAGCAVRCRTARGRTVAGARAERLENRVPRVHGRPSLAAAAELPGDRPEARHLELAMRFYPAPGKLNLFLHVLGRRDDGYHELQTVFRLVDRCDRVGIAVRPDGEVRFSGEFGERNLCVRAASLLKARTGARAGCDLVLEKRLPVGGGMGGGSSDAATVLLVLNREWKLDLAPAALAELGRELGADVPFFLFGRNALGEGSGERLTPLALPPAWYLVLTPQVCVSTREIFNDAALTRHTKRLT